MSQGLATEKRHGAYGVPTLGGPSQEGSTSRVAPWVGVIVCMFLRRGHGTRMSASTSVSLLELYDCTVVLLISYLTNMIRLYDKSVCKSHCYKKPTTERC